MGILLLYEALVRYQSFWDISMPNNNIYGQPGGEESNGQGRLFNIYIRMQSSFRESYP